ncbi:hypothetical protein [Gulosibacter sp. 10]|uniref:hypothetical protein n=1 Tax=Gulosibacter sp. 10 TaxID=1255570 RepID=UPI00097E9E0E|nr:hypothetical protein [Gulosibacter sp. 10]SJM50696.1 hypothetical protein FM112_01555 [Gulosibacter sp. 10]
MTERQNRAPRASWLKRGGVGLTASVLALGAGLGATSASAAEAQVTGVDFAWTINDEAGGGAYFGGCNFLVAGPAGDAGSSRLWTEGDGFYKTQDGNVTITKPDASGQQVQPTWGTKCQNSAGTAVNTQAGSTTANQVNLANGSGTVDPDAESATISWDGTFTIVFYGGMTYWSVKDVQLEVVDGVGTLSGTGFGYGADMYDPSKWVELPETPIDLATFSGVDVTETGLEVQPDYLGVEIEVEAGGPSGEQSRTGDNWGSFPQSLIDFNVATGQAAYWYSSGGAADPKKPAKPFSVSYALEDDGGEEPAPGEGEGGDIDVTIPETEDPTEPEEPGEPTGEFGWQWASEETVDLGAAAQEGDQFVASGQLNNVIVTDTRDGGEEDYTWTLSGQVDDFTSGSESFSGGNLGWVPKLVNGDTEVVTAGEAVESAAKGGEGLATAQQLAKSDAAASATVGADLELVVPDDTPAGNYSATLTVTALT